MAVTFVRSTGTAIDFAASLTRAFDCTDSDYMDVQGGGDRDGSGTTVTGITYAGAALTLQTTHEGPGGQPGRFGHKVAPATGTNNIVLSLSALAVKPMLVASCFLGVDQTTPWTDKIDRSTTSGDTSWACTNVTGIAHGLALYASSGLTITGGTGTTVESFNVAGIAIVAAFRESGTGSLTMNGTHSNAGHWGHAVSLSAAPTGGARRLVGAPFRLAGVGGLAA
jgi:hypothetical protein